MKNPVTITAVYLLISCNTKIEKVVDKPQLLSIDTTIKHKANFEIEWLKKLAKQLGLPAIDSGFNDFEIRIWANSMSDPDMIIYLKKNGSLIKSEKIFYEKDCNSIARVEKKNVYKKDSLEALIKKLDKIDFTKMISQDEIANFIDNVADGVTYTMEITTRNYYKELKYHCPEKFAMKEINNRKFVDLIFMLDKHLHFYVPFCPSEYKPLQ